MAAYEWKLNGLHKVSADIAAEVCGKLEDSRDGLTPKTLLEASRLEDAPLHGEFEWRDGVAAEQYRLYQARRIIVELTCTTVVDEKQVAERAFVSVRPNAPTAYVSLNNAMSNAEWEAHLFKQAMTEMAQFKAKYGRLQILSDVISAMTDVGA